jgi:hypothetical protein
MDTEESARQNPPYIPLMTLDNFAGKLKATVVPPVIDSSLTQSMSGGMAGALMSALKFLGLVDQAGNVRESLKKLVAAHATDKWGAALAEVIDPAYASIIGGLDLTTATPNMLDERFRKSTKATGQVLEKAVRFYLSALEKIERPISPLFKARKVRPLSSRKPARSANNKPVQKDEAPEEDEMSFEGMQQIKLPLPGKSDVILVLPQDFVAADWKFLEPILKMYIDRLLGSTT